MQNVTPYTRTPLVYNWSPSKLDKPMRSCTIYFSHPVLKIEHVYWNDGHANQPHPGKSYLLADSTVEGKKVTIQLKNDVVQVVGSHPYNDIIIEFTTIHPYIKMEGFVWYLQKDAIGPKKTASPKELETFNKSFHKAPPPPPTIHEPLDNSTSWNTEPRIKGKAEADSTVAVFVDGMRVDTTQSGEYGVWVFQIPPNVLEPGGHKYRFSAKLIYSDGEESEESRPVHYTVRPR